MVGVPHKITGVQLILTGWVIMPSIQVFQQTRKIGGIGNITATGIITASSFSGDGSGLYWCCVY